MPQALKVATLVFLGGALGSGLRFLVGLELDVAPMLFVVNSLGTLLLGFVNGKTWAPWVHPFFGTGIAGGFTTLSGVSLFINAHLAAEPISTALPLALMFALGFASHWLGMKLAGLVR